MAARFALRFELQARLLERCAVSLVERTFNRIKTSPAAASTLLIIAAITALPIPFPSISDWPMKIPRNTMPGIPWAWLWIQPVDATD
ncbi:hypothetical protein [Paraburkholderia bannensis]|uniref:hypothetical protein n=1 Tax=Paraburkholderia bannensis TaxID=765414 RepID=UPI002AB1F6CE|nr:hypothetical protein [Paraburkholderia bannensis]